MGMSFRRWRRAARSAASLPLDQFIRSGGYVLTDADEDLDAGQLVPPKEDIGDADDAGLE